MWDLPGPGLEPVSSALAGRFLTTAPPGKPLSLPFRCHLVPVSLCPNVPFLQGSQSYGLELTLVTSFNSITSLKTPNSKYSHILRPWGLGFQHMNLGLGDTIQPLTPLRAVMKPKPGGHLPK